MIDLLIVSKISEVKNSHQLGFCDVIVQQGKFNKQLLNDVECDIYHLYTRSEGDTAKYQPK